MKNAQEWIQEFDILYNGINSNIAPALDDYEKSVFLTMAQEEVVKSLYSGNSAVLGFESSEQLRRSLSKLIKTKSIKLTPQNNIADVILDSDVLYIFYEVVTTNKNNKLVVPVTYDDLYKTLQNPFKTFNNKRVLRVDTNTGVLLIGVSNNDSTYTYKYIKKPKPIILIDLRGTDDYINGSQIQSDCELDDSLHRTILQAAVNLAIAAQTR